MSTLTIYVYAGAVASIPAEPRELELTVQADADSAAGPVLTPIFTWPDLD